jgi:hypothetical protein
MRDEALSLSKQLGAKIVVHARKGKDYVVSDPEQLEQERQEKLLVAK